MRIHKDDKSSWQIYCQNIEQIDICHTNRILIVAKHALTPFSLFITVIKRFLKSTNLSSSFSPLSTTLGRVEESFQSKEHQIAVNKLEKLRPAWIWLRQGREKQWGTSREHYKSKSFIYKMWSSNLKVNLLMWQKLMIIKDPFQNLELSEKDQAGDKFRNIHF